jgi:cytochrome P450
MLSGWQEGETRDIHEELMLLTSEIVAKALFDADLRGTKTLGSAIHTAMRNFSSRRESLITFPVNFPTPSNLRLHRAVQKFDEIVYGFIERRRANGSDCGDLLSMLLRVRDEDGSSMTDKQLRDEAITFFLAGQETTASALAWSWYLLSQSPLPKRC